MNCFIGRLPNIDWVLLLSLDWFVVIILVLQIFCSHIQYKCQSFWVDVEKELPLIAKWIQRMDTIVKERNHQLLDEHYCHQTFIAESVVIDTPSNCGSFLNTRVGDKKKFRATKPEISAVLKNSRWVGSLQQTDLTVLFNDTKQNKVIFYHKNTISFLKKCCEF